jgi:aspartate/methionine/tyrosine aminotransferase
MAEANDREASGEDVIHMEVGQPGTPAPHAAINAAKKAIENERLGYTEALGLPKLRERIARHYRDFYNVEVEPRRIIVTTGSSAGFILAFLSLFDAGARVALPSPSYPCYRHILKALGVEPIMIDTALEPRWMPTPATLNRLREHTEIGGLLVASPSNPTGTMLVGDSLKLLAETCDANELWLISDEIYHGLAALDALDELETYKSVYEVNRSHLLEELPKAGFSKILPADGAFYLYVNVQDFTGDSVKFAERMLNETGVAATPGVDFDPQDGHQYLRFSYAGKTADMVEATSRLKRWMST